MEYSVYDAKMAGFEKVIFVINKHRTEVNYNERYK